MRLQVGAAFACDPCACSRAPTPCALPCRLLHAERNGTADGLTTAPLAPAKASDCNTTILAFLKGRPELSTMVQLLEAAGAAVGAAWCPVFDHLHPPTCMLRSTVSQLAVTSPPRLCPCPPRCAGVAPLLEDSNSTASITLFAPTNDAFKAVPAAVDLKDVETLQQASGRAVWRARHQARAGAGSRGVPLPLCPPASRTPSLPPPPPPLAPPAGPSVPHHTGAGNRARRQDDAARG